MSIFRDVLILHGSGVGGGSLGYANVLMQPGDELFEAPGWKDFADWKTVLQPHYDMARKMLGVTTNPRLWPADHVLKEISEEIGYKDEFRPTDVGVFFGEEGETVPDPYFEGEGPDRTGCIYCGGCMVGCRYNAKNTLVKNYLYFAEKGGAEVRPEATVTNIQPLSDQDARYEITYERTTGFLVKLKARVKARHVIISAGVLGTLKLLMTCRDITGTLPAISQRLGEKVRTNSEAFVGATSRKKDVNYSEGISITSVMRADPVTHIEPVRYPDGSSFIRLLSAPMVKSGTNVIVQLLRMAWYIIRHPIDFLDAKIFSRWAYRTTILMIMQTEDNFMRLKLGRSLLNGFRQGLVSQPDEEAAIPPRIESGVKISERFAEETNGILMGAFNEGAFNVPSTAHIMGGATFGRNAEEGVIDLDCQVHHYPGLYIIDGSIIPANPGINPSLTITALAEYAMSLIEPKEQ